MLPKCLDNTLGVIVYSSLSIIHSIHDISLYFPIHPFVLILDKFQLLYYHKLPECYPNTLEAQIDTALDATYIAHDVT